MKRLLLLAILFSSCTKAQNFFMLQSENSFSKAIQTVANTGRYVSFGNMVAPSSSTIKLTARSGTSHIANGRIEWYNYDIATNAWSGPSTLFTPAAGKDYRDPRIGILGDEKYMLFTSVYTTTGGTFDNLGYFLSTDLTGNSWGSYQTLTPPSGLNAFITYGPLIETHTPGKYYAVAYGFNTAQTNFKVWLWEINYSGGAITSINTIIVYDGSQKITESAIEYLGEDDYIIISRVNDVNILKQFTSTDGGATWSAPVDTDMGAGTTGGDYEALMPDLFTFEGELYCIYQDRVTGYLMVGRNIGTDPLEWNPFQYQLNTKYSGGPFFLGYPTAINVPGFTDRVMISWASETSSSTTTLKARLENFSAF